MSESKPAAEQPVTKKRKLNEQHVARVSLIEGSHKDLPKETQEIMKTLHTGAQNYAFHIKVSLESGSSDFKFDPGRVTAALDLIQQAKNVLDDALILPHTKND